VFHLYYDPFPCYSYSGTWTTHALWCFTHPSLSLTSLLHSDQYLSNNHDSQGKCYPWTGLCSLVLSRNLYIVAFIKMIVLHRVACHCPLLLIHGVVVPGHCDGHGNTLVLHGMVCYSEKPAGFRQTFVRLLLLPNVLAIVPCCQ
jgi:hypothetical protein